jgi:eukaryotic-like serine/threonine-protein kinase
MPEEEFHKKKTLPGLIQEQKAVAGLTHTPKMIGPYEIECLLEKGGMSYLYLGTHPETKQLTTIKVLSPRFLSHPDAVQRFLNEAEIIAMTDHPNIVKLYGHGEWEGGLYIAMEYIHGNSLRQVLLQSLISLKRALEIIVDIAYALCHLHTHGVIHRDLKPENILITESGQVKVIDFGIAQLLTEKSTQGSTPKQRLIGTPIYMSPEQRENPETVSYPSDIYSLGIIAYELVLGKLSHGHIHLSLMPKGIQKILNKVLQPQPRDRYQDIVDFITDVSAYLNSTHLQKEKKAGDQLSELSENLRNVQDILSSQRPTEWKEIEVGIATHKGISLYGSYYDFFILNNGQYGIILAESSATGAKGMLYTSMLRGMIQSLKHLDNNPSEMIRRLNQLVIDDQMEEIFTLNYLIFSSKENLLKYTCCGHGNLWRISAASKTASQVICHNIAIGIDPEVQFSETVLPFELNDSFVLSSHASSILMEGIENKFLDFFPKAIEESSTDSPQNLVDSILRKIKLTFSRQISETSFTLISIKKNEDTTLT